MTTKRASLTVQGNNLSLNACRIIPILGKCYHIILLGILTTFVTPMNSSFLPRTIDNNPEMNRRGIAAEVEKIKHNYSDRETWYPEADSSWGADAHIETHNQENIGSIFPTVHTSELEVDPKSGAARTSYLMTDRSDAGIFLEAPSARDSILSADTYYTRNDSLENSWDSLEKFKTLSKSGWWEQSYCSLDSMNPEMIHEEGCHMQDVILQFGGVDGSKFDSLRGGIEHHADDVVAGGNRLGASIIDIPDHRVQNLKAQNKPVDKQHEATHHSEVGLLESEIQYQPADHLVPPMLESYYAHEHQGCHIYTASPGGQHQKPRLISRFPVNEKYIQESEQNCMTERAPPSQPTRPFIPTMNALVMNHGGSDGTLRCSYSSHTVNTHRVHSQDTHQTYVRLNPFDTLKQKLNTMRDGAHTHQLQNQMKDTKNYGKYGGETMELLPDPAIQLQQVIVPHSKKSTLNDLMVQSNETRNSRTHIFGASTSTLKNLPHDDLFFKSEAQCKKRLLKSLETEGSLVIGRCKDLPSIIETMVFSTIEKVSAISGNTMEELAHIFLQEGLESVKSYFIKGFFGGVCVICQDKNILDLDTVINLAWKFMCLEYFARWALMSFEDIMTKGQRLEDQNKKGRLKTLTMEGPEDLLAYLVHRKRRDQYSEKALVQILKQFCLWTRSQSGVKPIIFREESFWNTCEKMKRRRKRYDSYFTPVITPMTSISPTPKKRSRISQIFSDSNNTPSMSYGDTDYPLKSDFDPIIWTKGVLLIQSDSVLQKNLETYFENLATKLNTGDSNTPPKPNLYRKVTMAAHLFVTPAFLGMVKVFHENDSVTTSLNVLIRHACEFLKTIFSEWENKKTTKSKRTIHAELTGRTKNNNVDWSNPQESLNFFSREGTRRAPPSTYVLYLARQWQGDLVQSGIEISGKEISPGSEPQ